MDALDYSRPGSTFQSVDLKDFNFQSKNQFPEIKFWNPNRILMTQALRDKNQGLVGTQFVRDLFLYPTQYFSLKKTILNNKNNQNFYWKKKLQ